MKAEQLLRVVYGQVVGRIHDDITLLSIQGVYDG